MAELKTIRMSDIQQEPVDWLWDSYPKTIKPRLEQLGADNDMIEIIVENEDELSFTDERIEQTIIKFNAKLVVLDPVQAYFGGANMNNRHREEARTRPKGAAFRETKSAERTASDR
ncbi:MAG: hypothetical protein FWG87_12135 [Defluviitaleaceae bacterium]|nr:hypothetical protein [Defluviitaleaceae bacterium]